jgi:hypothetical protein
LDCNIETERPNKVIATPFAAQNATTTNNNGDGDEAT